MDAHNMEYSIYIGKYKYIILLSCQGDGKCARDLRDTKYLHTLFIARKSTLGKSFKC